MIKLNLTAKNQAEEKIKEYLENNVSENLADKINNGVLIRNDNITLLNKKDLSTFMTYANQEARKLADKGANFACIDHITIFGWAMHYFEKETIEGVLLNQDGSEYKQQKAKPVKKETPKKELAEPTLFDLLSTENTKTESAETDEDFTEEEMQEVIKNECVANVDLETGEVLKNISIDKDIMILLHSLLDGKLEVE
ncbi:MAG: hypothetical protein IKT27_01735 [Clostridia bacterium]|nr:hypothetical protein [Clostridia bacterium]MBR5012710.1 hypothetical protein [Clostridia bacterium]